MKQVIALGTIILTLLFVASCDDKSCDNVNCNNSANSECVNGRCQCIQGFEGEFCDEYSYMKYIGNYQASSNCRSTTQGNVTNPHNPYISQGNRIDQLLINGFEGQYTVEAYINGNYITIPEQNIFGSISITGNGQFFPDSRRITFDYEIIQGSNFQSCSATYVKIN